MDDLGFLIKFESKLSKNRISFSIATNFNSLIENSESFHLQMHVQKCISLLFLMLIHEKYSIAVKILEMQ
jgi:hypothetical protein